MAKRSSSKPRGPNRYVRVVADVFAQKYTAGATVVAFDRDDLEAAVVRLKVKRPKNLGDIVYYFRSRAHLPSEITGTAAAGKEWLIFGAGDGKYEMRLWNVFRVQADQNYATVKIPDATPEIVVSKASDEQYTLAVIRYNRLIDIFLGITSYSLQNHLRTKVPGVGQIEIDELYIGVDKLGRQYAVPVQVKRGTDRISPVQIVQDYQFCAHKLPNLIARSIAVQLLSSGTSTKIAMFELQREESGITIVEQRHYQLVPAADISAADLRAAAGRT